MGQYQPSYESDPYPTSAQGAGPTPYGGAPPYADAPPYGGVPGRAGPTPYGGAPPYGDAPGPVGPAPCADVG